MHDTPETYKRFPRTLEEAFPRHYREHFNPFYQPPRDKVPPDYWAMLGVCFALGFVVGLLVVGA